MTCACGSLAKGHLVAQVSNVEAQAASDSPIGAARETIFAKLGMTCSWQEAQGADMAACIVLIDARGLSEG